MAALVDNAAAGRFEMVVDGATCFVSYRREAGCVSLLHADVPRALEGRGIGSRLVRAVLDAVRAEGARAVPVCPFVARVIERHPEYRDLL